MTDRLRRCAPAACVVLLAAAGSGEEVVVRYPDGKIKATYTLDEQGRKHGFLVERFDSGKTKLKAQYAAGVLNGPWLAFHESGGKHIDASYKGGKLHGRYVEYDPAGGVRKTCSYKDGDLHGRYQEFDAGREVKDQQWFEGVLYYPKSLAQIRAAIRKIDSARIETVGEKPDTSAMAGVKLRLRPISGRADAVRALMIYRYLCDVPYEDLALDRRYNAYADAGVALLNAARQMSHNPPNPGWPEAAYRFGLQGTSRSNIHSSSRVSLARSVHSYMNDSDSRNVDRLGHRRWCLNPAMQRLGISGAGGYSAMYVFDRSRKEIPDYDFIAFPPRGFLPLKYFKKHYAWNVSPNPAKYQAPSKGKVKVEVFPVGRSLKKASRPVALDYFNVNNTGFGVRYCIIYRPKLTKLPSGQRFMVEIAGLRKSGGSEATIRYVVEFVRL